MPPLKRRRQELFCVKAVEYNDYTKAYIEAGYKAVTDNSRNVAISQLLSNDNVQKRLTELKQRIANRVEVSAAKVINELGRIAFSDPRKVIGDDGAILDPKAWDDDTAGAIAGLETEKIYEGKGKDKVFVGYAQKVKLWDKNTALANLAKHFKLLNESNPLEGMFAGSNVSINVYLPSKKDGQPVTIVNGNGAPHANGHGESNGAGH